MKVHTAITNTGKEFEEIIKQGLESNATVMLIQHPRDSEFYASIDMHRVDYSLASKGYWKDVMVVNNNTLIRVYSRRAFIFDALRNYILSKRKSKQDITLDEVKTLVQSLPDITFRW